jgi:hypothetical protein
VHDLSILTTMEQPRDPGHAQVARITNHHPFRNNLSQLRQMHCEIEVNDAREATALPIKLQSS